MALMSARFDAYLQNAGLGSLAPVLITVGPTGDYTTMNAALAAAKKYRPGYATKGITVEIRQEAEFVFAEQVFVVQDDLSYITVTSEGVTTNALGAEIVIQRDALISGNGGQSNNWRTGIYPAWCAMRGAQLPFIRTLYDMDTSGTGEGTVGVYIFENSKGVIARGAGVKNSGYRGLYVDAGDAYVRATIWSGSGFAGGPEGTAAGIRGSNGSRVAARQVDCTNCNDGAYFSDSFVTVSDGDFSDAAGVGLAAQAGAMVYGGGPKADRCGTYGFQATDGGKMTLSESSLTDGVYSSAVDCTGSAVFVDDGGQFFSDRGTFSTVGSGVHAVVVAGGSTCNMPASTITASSGRAVSQSEASNTNFQGATLDGSSDGFRSFNGGTSNLCNAKVSSINLAGGTIVAVNSSTTALDGVSAYSANVIPGEFSTAGAIIGADERVLFRTTDASFTLSSTSAPEVIMTANLTAGRNVTLPDSSTMPSKRFRVTHAGTGSPMSLYLTDGTTRIATIAVGESISVAPDNGTGWVITSSFRRTVRRSQGNSAFTMTPSAGQFVVTSTALTADRIVTMYDPADRAAVQHTFTRNDDGAFNWLLQTSGGGAIASIAARQWVQIAPLADGSGWYVVARGSQT